MNNYKIFCMKNKTSKIFGYLLMFEFYKNVILKMYSKNVG